jgi:hypothetical protein
MQSRNMLKANFKKYDNGSEIYNPTEPYASEPLKSKYYDSRSVQHI